jgi:hypothetical protein
MEIRSVEHGRHAQVAHEPLGQAAQPSLGLGDGRFAGGEEGKMRQPVEAPQPFDQGRGRHGAATFLLGEVEDGVAGVLSWQTMEQV